MTLPPLPPSLGRYRPIAELGAGAMGIVYKAEDPVIGRTVAIKVVRAETLDAETKADYLERFRLEVQAAGRCAHVGIVGVYDYAENDGNPFIVMELVEGKTLQRLLREPESRATLDPIALALQILDALACAHGLGIIHRDIKPANIMVTPAGQAKIADFGIARARHGSDALEGGMIGTPSYMAPEQVTGHAVDHRADLFAAGAILYEMLAGKPPFSGGSLNDTIYRLGGPDPAPIEPIEQSRLPQLAPILAKALAKDPAQRYQAAPEFAAALRATLALPEDSDRTVIIRPGSPTPAAAPYPFAPDFLKLAEQHLGQFLGPVARVLVGNAAKRASGNDELIDLLARAITKDADRDAFRRRVGRGDPGNSGTRSATGTGPSGRTSPTAPGLALAPATLDAIQSALAFHVGPIARILVRQTVAQARSLPDLADRLVANIRKPEDAEKFRKELNAILAR
ncbi:MAG TPA: serine/threonine-protein kinase [Aliidongia sp.]|nr:serine/threonine-protein kinase [Aliidongia sp.]